MFDFQCQHGFLYFSFQCLFLGQEGVFGQLLRNRTAALGDTAVGQVGDDGAENANGIDADVFVETVVFGGDEGVLQVGRYFVDIDGKTVLIGVQSRDQAAVAVEYLG